MYTPPPNDSTGLAFASPSCVALPLVYDLPSIKCYLLVVLIARVLFFFFYVYGLILLPFSFFLLFLVLFFYSCPP